MQTKIKLIGAAATVAALTAVGVGVAAASPQPTPASPGSTSTTSAGASTAAHQHKWGLERRALHGEVTLGGAKKQRVIDFQRGTVTAVDGNTVTVKSVDGFTASYVAGPKTKVRKDKAPSTIAAVGVNDRVRVVALKTGTTDTLRLIGDHGPK